MARFSKNRAPKTFPLRVSFPPPEVLEEDFLLCFLGHNTVFLRAGGRTLLFDPILGPIGGVLRRRTPPPLSPESLPSPDLVLVSHAHLDHLDRPTLKRLSGDFTLVAGVGTHRYLERNRLVELDWLEERVIFGVRILGLPVQHWSQRGLFDHNRSLWLGFLVEVAGLRLFFGGDTGYFRGFREIGAEFGPFDLALLPCGAYEPRELMAPFHMTPEEAVQAALDLRAEAAVPLHWGAYFLGDEPPEEPPQRFAEEARRRGLRARVLYPGEILRLDRSL
ncbi:MBL fold metallo-hydrolase [Thermosulfurimonas sp. F29]|uniref:MBL fold metallo-hydrolase n=1 Tax=Thermosulfurimonas sp. F29 TaxID=2867247 RepID=UPI001C8291C0|nr:MBL fold metallo-hydrolase [Thermosulfurimonas sp. F29]MBX6422998.1 MBL fold metallo-hydrolase [Thermosulfurimonas sp. F29]